ncbi:MAG: RNA-binding transcriptional accessory protein [Bdellovibrionales bacterium]|nr:RNA-binding transcriptional accessory protein [Bdellovibrionales bacterium]
MDALNLDSSFQNFAKVHLSNLKLSSIEAVLALHADGGTVPFIARYRKEKTGNLDEVQIRLIVDQYEIFEELKKRKAFVLQEIEKQGALTDDLKKQITESLELAEIEELYRPFKRKKKTKAKLAAEAGIAPLADWIWELGHSQGTASESLEMKAKNFLNVEAGFATYEEVLRGAQHIIVEKISSVADLRTIVREEYLDHGKIVSEIGPKFKSHSKYEMYSEFSESVKKLMEPKASHRYLALRRGWQENELKVSMSADDEKLLASFENYSLSQPQSIAADFLKTCAKIALTIHVKPSIENELHRMLKDKADEHAIHVFAENVRNLLMASPFGAKVVLGVDPGLRTGCKIALVDGGGRFISHTVMKIVGEDAEAKAKKLFDEVFKQIKIEVVAVGNGTGGRETEAFLRKIFKELGINTPVIMVNESGASVYSASDLAREEFPDLDLTIRGAISIARRLQDPLAELVKIDPKSIGVGQYQHDVSQTQLKKSLHGVVESCVNQVGVDLNTASPSLLQYVAGIGPAIAKNVVEYREKKGLFKNREDLKQVGHFSTKVFEQSAGFLRISNGSYVLDKTGIHPERYPAVEQMAKEIGENLESMMAPASIEKLKSEREKWVQLVGEYTYQDILEELAKPGRDPRDPFQLFQFREDIHEVKDLENDMICPGIVTNVTNFGAFVDIGVHQDGLVHISELSYEFVQDPRQVVNPGDQVKVKVLSVDKEKSQISLSMLLEPKPQVKARPTQKRDGQKPRPKKDHKGTGKERVAKGKGAPRKGKPSHGKGPQGKGRRPDQNRRPAAAPFNNPFADLKLK